MFMGKWSVVVSVLVVALVAGCSTPTTTSSKTVFEMMQDKANEITAAGGLAAVGMGESRVINTAMDRAKNRGRQEIARMIEVKVNSLQKDFTEEIGEGKGSEFNSLFSNASKLITSQTLRGSVAKDIKWDKKDSIITGYALMVLDPKVIASAFQDQANSARQLYTRFRASQAFEDLDKEVKKFDEYKKNQGLSLQ